MLPGFSPRLERLSKTCHTKALNVKLPGTKFLDINAAQRNNLAETASNPFATIRALLDKGVLVNQNGSIIPNSQR
jgi:hypothetical protein